MFIRSDRILALSLLVLVFHATALAADHAGSDAVAVIRFNSIERTQRRLSELGWSGADIGAIARILPHGPRTLELFAAIRDLDVGWSLDQPLVVLLFYDNPKNTGVALRLEDAPRCIELLGATAADGNYTLVTAGRQFRLSAINANWLLISSSQERWSGAHQSFISGLGKAALEQDAADEGRDLTFVTTTNTLLCMLGLGVDAVQRLSNAPLSLTGYGSFRPDGIVLTCESDLPPAREAALRLDGPGMEARELLAGLPASRLSAAAGFDDSSAAAWWVMAYSRYMQEADYEEEYRSLGLEAPYRHNPAQGLPELQKLVPLAGDRLAWNWLTAGHGFYLAQVRAVEAEDRDDLQTMRGRIDHDADYLRIMLPTCGGALPFFSTSVQGPFGAGHSRFTVNVPEELRLPRSTEPMNIYLLGSNRLLRLCRWDAGSPLAVLKEADGELVDVDGVRRTLALLGGRYKGVVLAEPMAWAADWAFGTGPFFHGWPCDDDIHVELAEILEPDPEWPAPFGLGLRPVSEGTLRLDVAIPMDTLHFLQFLLRLRDS